MTVVIDVGVLLPYPVGVLIYMATFVSDYRAILSKIGEAAFRKKYFVPVLVGRGLVGELDQRPPERKTAVMRVYDQTEAQSVDKLNNRVWVLQPQLAGNNTHIAVGRAVSNDIVIPEYSISGNHCIFLYELRALAIEDIGSLNGTMVGDIRIAPSTRVRLASGDMITLGRYQFSFFTAQGFLDYLREYK